MRHFADLAELGAAVGSQLGYSDWLTVDQDRIDRFADATGDHQWLHVDVERAAAGPYGTTIAHGYLTLALLPVLVRQVYAVHGLRMVVNYGLDRVRFPAPLPTGGRIRGGVTLLDVTDVPGGVQLRSTVTVEREGADKPCCVAETVTRLYP